MPETSDDADALDADALLTRSVRLKLFAVLRHTRDPQRLKPVLPAHLRWMVDSERSGDVFLSGPITAGAEAARLDGLTVVRARDRNAAEALVRGDPLVAQGIVAVDVCEWTVNEGMIPLRLTLSDATFAVP